MGTQTKKLQQRILAAAAARSELDTLAWFVEMKIGPVEHAGAPWPGSLVPVVPVAGDAETSRQWAEILEALFKGANVGREFALALTSWDVLEATGVAWYEWGERKFDMVCPGCGAINDDCICQAIKEVMSA